MSANIEAPTRRLLRARDAMDPAYAEPLDVRAVAAVAAVAHLSEPHFIRSFRPVFGETPSRYRVGHGPMVAPNCFQLAATRSW